MAISREAGPERESINNPMQIEYSDTQA